MTAPWAARYGHSTVIDARTRAIYVIGGHNGTTHFNDVFVSTDGGVRPDSAGGQGYWGCQDLRVLPYIYHELI
jgi:hypothetical protein